MSTPKGRATGYLPGVERLDILPLRFVDGPLGVRDGEAIAFPTPIAIGANCDRSLASRTGRAIAAQASAKGHGVLLAPGLNVTRVPTAGRNFEYLSEDPRLTAELGTAYLRGVQAGNVAATAKHFVANNQDRDRNGIDVVIDERTLREVYLPAFRAAVDAGVGAVMTAYNRVRSQLMSEHRELIEEILRDEWGFEGPTVSDWWGTHDTAAAVDGGLDVEMPGVSVPRLYAPHSALLRALVSLDLSGRVGIDPPLYWRFYDRLFGENGQPDPYPASYFGDRLRHSLSVEEVTVAAINQKVRRVLGLYDTLGHLEPEGEFDAIFDGHTGEGSKLGRGTRFFKTRGARVGPEGEGEHSARWQRLAMILDDERDYDAAELDRAVEPVDPDDPWHEPEQIGDEADKNDAGGSDRNDADEADRDADGSDENDADDSRGSLSDFSS